MKNFALASIAALAAQLSPGVVAKAGNGRSDGTVLVDNIAVPTGS